MGEQGVFKLDNRPVFGPDLTIDRKSDLESDRKGFSGLTTYRKSVLKSDRGGVFGVDHRPDSCRLKA